MRMRREIDGEKEITKVRFLVGEQADFLISTRDLKDEELPSTTKVTEPENSSFYINDTTVRF